jgi:ATP-dependent DNA ligase
MSKWTHEQLKGKKWNGQPYSVRQHKEDGWRATVFKQQDNSVLIFGKRHDPELEFIKRFPRLQKDLKELFKAMPRKSSVDMEICAGAGVRESVITALKDRSMPLRFVAFAVPFLGGCDLREKSLSDVEKIVRSWDVGLGFAKYEIGNPIVKDSDEHREWLLNKAGILGIEGWMLKSGGQYGTWWKVKVEPTIDCVVMGVVPGCGKYQNLVGSLRLGLWPDKYVDGKADLKEVATASGMTDDQRREMTGMNQGGRLRGRVAEVQFQRVGSGGRLLHPRFVRWREDKSSEQCRMRQLEEGE